MSYEQISYRVEDAIATVTFERPDKLNAFTVQMMGEVIAALDQADADDEVRAIVFTGRGRAFCAGADLTSGIDIFKRGDGEFNMETQADGGGKLTRRIFECRKPVIAAINGPAVGIGLTMTLAMDMRLAANTARMSFVFSRRGLVPEAASSWFLPRIVGISRALEWVLTGRLMEAKEALDGGLVRSLHPPEKVLDAAYELASEIADNTSSVSVALSRRMLWRMLGEVSPRTAHEIDSRGIAALGVSADAQEGVESFLGRRPPRFPMRVSSDMPDFFERWTEHETVDEFLAAERARVGQRPTDPAERH